MSWKRSKKLMDTIGHYSNFVSQIEAPNAQILTGQQPATGVSLRQMVQFGEKPSTGRSTTT